MIKGLVIAGTNSGAGKTTVTMGLLAALKRKGIRVAPFKVGPDFIDPGHHTAITKRVSRNLDGWMLSRDHNLATFARGCREVEMAVVEGAMGLFDGYDGKSEAGSTAQMAKWLGLPVLLVVNAKSMARSAAALVKGFTEFDPDLNFAGVLFNNVGSRRHLDYLQEALGAHCPTPVWGGIVRDEKIALPERHLGLITQEERPLTRERQDYLADLIVESIDLESRIQSLPHGEQVDRPLFESAPYRQTGKGVSIAVARDRAFCFYYQDNLDSLEATGARLVFFSPMEAGNLPKNIGGLYLGGGYPELHASKLAANRQLLEQIRQASRFGMPIYAECGGFIYLCRDIEDISGQAHAMAGVFDFSIRMLPRRKALGYREVALTIDTILGPRGQVMRGHEFHYSEIKNPDRHPGARSIYRVSDRAGLGQKSRGYLVDNTLGSYFHLHFGSAPPMAANFVESCRSYLAAS